MTKTIKSIWLVILGLSMCLLSTTAKGYSAEMRIIKKKSNVTYLSDMKPVSVKGKYMQDKDSEGNKIDLSGIGFEKGLCVSSDSELTYRLDGKYSTLKAVIGNDSAFAEYTGKLIFEVYADGKKIYESKPIGQNEKKEIKVPLEAAKEINLKVKNNGSFSNFAVWAEAHLL